MDETAVDPESVDYIPKDIIDPTWPYQLTSEILSLPTLLIIIVLGFQHYRKGFNGTFPKLIYITILNDIWAFFVQVIIFRWPQSGLFTVYGSFDHVIPSVFLYFWVTSFCHQHLLILLIAINRVHSVRAPVFHQHFWEDHVTKFLLLTFLLPQPLCIFVGFQGAHYNHVAIKRWYMHTSVMQEAPGHTLLFSTVVISLFTGIFNGFSMVQLLLWRKQSARRDFRRNLSFLIYTILTFIMEILYNVMEIGIHYLPTSGFLQKTATFGSNVTIDILCLSSIWLWLCMSKDARQLIWKKEQKNTVVWSISSKLVKL